MNSRKLEVACAVAEVGGLDDLFDDGACEAGLELRHSYPQACVRPVLTLLRNSE